MEHRTTQAVLGLLLNANGAISGQSISKILGITRSAVWKHIERLRESGYEIASATRRGYTLGARPNCPLPAEVLPHLRTKTVGQAYRFLTETDSTNRVAGELAKAGAPEGAVVTADCQTGGRGRMQRRWFSPAGANLYMSVILRPAMPPAQAQGIALVAAAASLRAIHDLFPNLLPQVKWPNDVFVHNRKLAGILCDMQSEADRIHYLVLGIGINVNMAESDFPPEIRPSATSLQVEFGGPVNRPQVAASWLNHFEQAYTDWLENGLARFIPELTEQSILLGRHVVLRQERTVFQGVVTGLSRNGGLRMRLDDGSERVLLAGDVHVQDW